MGRTFRMLSDKVSTSKRKMLHMLHCPEPIAGTYRFDRCTYTNEEISHRSNRDLFCNTLHDCRKCSKISSYTYQSYGLVS